MILQTNVLGTTLIPCSNDPLTGWFRDGYCHHDANDYGTHIICGRVTREFLKFTNSRGNNLTSLREGDFWCMCIFRWLEAYEYGIKTNNLKVIPLVKLESSNINVLNYVDMNVLNYFKV
jgi:uncharacterized protein (DUF2237 family)